MATISEDNDSWAAGGIKRRDFRHSHDGPEELPARGVSKKKRKPHFKGCPERGGGAHIYVWIQFNGQRRLWYQDTDRGWTPGKTKPVTWYERLCVGCDHRNTKRYPWGGVLNGEIYEVRTVDYDCW